MIEPVLIVQSGFLGDAVLASGMLRAIAAVQPEMPVGMVVRAEFAELFAGHPGLAHLHPFDKKDRRGAIPLVEMLKEIGYGMAFLPHRSYRSAIIARNAGIARRIGFRQGEGAALLTDRVEYEIARHETGRNGMLLERGGIGTTADSRRPWLAPAQSMMERMRAAHGNDPIVVAPGSVWATKRWLGSGYADLARRLVVEGRCVLLVGGPSEQECCAAIAAEAGLPPEANLAGKLSLTQLLALIAAACLVVTNDSAPLHLAESVGTPVTAVFGPTVPEFGFGPLSDASSVVQIEGLLCRPCRIHGSEACPIGTHECMTGISADQVLAASATALAR